MSILKRDEIFKYILSTAGFLVNCQQLAIYAKEGGADKFTVQASMGIESDRLRTISFSDKSFFVKYLLAMKHGVLWETIISDYRRIKVREELELLSKEDNKHKNWESYTMFIAIILFLILTMVTFIGLIVTMKKVDVSFYELRLTPFIVILMISMSICMCWRYFGKENSKYLVIWTALAGIACAVILPEHLFPGNPEPFYGSSITTHNMVGFMVPFAFLLIISSIIKIIKRINKKSVKKTLHSISPHIVHLGVAFIIIGYIASQTMAIKTTHRLREGETLVFGAYKIKVIDIEIEENTGDVDAREFWDTCFVTVEIYENDLLVEKNTMKFTYTYYYDEQGNLKVSMVDSEIAVTSFLFEDLYMYFNILISQIGVTDHEIELVAQTLPMMSFLWNGMWLFVIGIFIRISINYLPQKKIPVQKRDAFSRTGKKRIQRISPTSPIDRIKKGTVGKRKEKKKEMDYEKMLEDELRKFRG